MPEAGGALPVTQCTPPADLDPDAWQAVRYLAFARPASSGEFTDYTARYGALLDEDRLSPREKLSRSAAALPGQSDRPIPEEAMERALGLMGLEALADLPAIALSSGQTRRARIAHALMYRPRVLLLEDPMAGLDAPSREKVKTLLGQMNASGSPRVVLVLRDRGEDTLADWVSHVAEVRAGRVWLGTRDAWVARRRGRGEQEAATYAASAPASADAPIIELNGVSVSYGAGARPVLRNVDWSIKPGSRWHLQGANGSGKTTLLSVMLGLHPQSYSLPASALTIFGQPRRRLATTLLRRRVGHSSPEIFAAFPRNMSLSAYDAVGTGFEGVFARRSLAPQQKARVLQLIEWFKPQLRAAKDPEDISTRDIALREFAHFTPPQQALLVFLRAVVGQPELLILDEPTQGMDEEIWAACRQFLKEEWETEAGRRQAVVVVSHYEDEVPWSHGRVLRLVDGVAEVE